MAYELPMSVRLTGGSAGSASPPESDPTHLLPTPSALESTPTDEYVDELRAVIDPEDPHHRAYLPGRRAGYFAQRTLSRTAAALLPTPRTNEMHGAFPHDRPQKQDNLHTRITRLLPTPIAHDGKPDKSTPKRGKGSLERGGGLTLTDAIELRRQLLPTPVARDAIGTRRSTAKTEEWASHDGTTLTDAVWEVQGRETDTRGKLLPTPTSQAAKHGEPTPTELEMLDRGEDKTNLWLRVHRLADDEPGKLLPTPEASDRSGGRVMSDEAYQAKKRPSGTKAAVTLATAVDQETQLLPTPAATDGKGKDMPSRQGQASLRDVGALLPTPVSNPQNPGAGGELRAALEHGPGRRNETGTESWGQPNRGRTPLLPTPKVTAERSSRRAMVENQQWSAPTLAQAVELARGELPREFESWDEVPGWSQEIRPDPKQLPLEGSDSPPPVPADPADTTVASAATENMETVTTWSAPADAMPLLPTPQARDGENASEQQYRAYEGQGDNPTLLGAARRVTGTSRGHGEKLLPTPLKGDADGGRTTKGQDRQAETGLRLTAKAIHQRSTGASTPGPSSDGRESSGDQHPPPPTSEAG